MKPNRKVGAGALGGALSVILVWALVSFAHLDIPAEVASAFTTIIVFATSSFVPE